MNTAILHSIPHASGLFNLKRNEPYFLPSKNKNTISGSSYNNANVIHFWLINKLESIHSPE